MNLYRPTARRRRRADRPVRQTARRAAADRASCFPRWSRRSPACSTAPGVAARLGAYALLLSGMGIMVLIGQRMPLLLTGPRPAGDRAAAAEAARRWCWSPGRRRWRCWSRDRRGLAADLLPAGAEVLRADGRFPDQCLYGEIYTRALEIGAQHPLFGRGYDGFRTGCPMPRYFRPTLDGKRRGWRRHERSAHGIRTISTCRRWTMAAFPGWRCSRRCALAWLWPLARGLWRSARSAAGRPVRLGRHPALADRIHQRLHLDADGRLVLPAARLGPGRGTLARRLSTVIAPSSRSA